jgi:hypothetical protein
MSKIRVSSESTVLNVDQAIESNGCIICTTGNNDLNLLRTMAEDMIENKTVRSLSFPLFEITRVDHRLTDVLLSGRRFSR